MKLPGMTDADWSPYMGNNHARIPAPTITYGGSVSFAKHFGDPLTQRLWEDLVHRLCISGLCVYTPNQGQWMLGWGPGHCIIQLDEHGYVADISIVPYPRPKEDL